MQQEQYDAVVVGAGPAGLSAAIELSTRGWRTLVVEKSAAGRDKVCGGFVGPENQKILKSFGMWDRVFERGAQPIRRMSLVAPSGRAIRFSMAPEGGKDCGVGVSRSLFDKTLAEAAEQKGVEIAYRHAVHTVEKDGPRLRLLIWNKNERCHETIVSGRVIVSSGAARGRHRKEKGFFGISASFKNVSDMREHVMLYFVKNGHAGLNAFEGDLTNLCYVADTALFDDYGGNIEKIYEVLKQMNPALSQKMAGAKRATPWRGIFIPTKTEPVFYRENSFLCGDAVDIVHPVVGGGITLAMASGKLLAGVLNDFGTRYAAEGEVIRSYEKSWREHFSKKINRSHFWGALSHRPFLTESMVKLLNLKKNWWEKLYRDYHSPFVLGGAIS